MDLLVHFFSGFRWQDALDILLNTYILFRLYIIFRGTAIFRAILSICLLWAMGQTAMNLGLILTNWAMQGVIAAAAIIVVIIFRNEIAEVLQGGSLKYFLWDIPRRQDSLPYEIIVDAVYEMAHKKIGALIVLPMHQSLDSVIQDGVALDCRLNHQSITGIFWPGAPMHDGACIIKGDRIIKAGAILPLSIRKDMPAFFGTRHRAAMGLASQTDAVVIVVSEERGKISIFTKNDFQFIKSPDALEETLKSLTGTRSKDKISSRPTYRFAMAAFVSLFCVTGLWLNLSKGMETFAIKEVPLEFARPDHKMEIMYSSVSDVKLHISGARPLIDTLKPDQIKVKVTIDKCKAGENILSITHKNISLPPGLQLKSIEPDQVNIFLDKFVEKRLPIQPCWVGKLPKGLAITKAKTIPDNIIVKGGAQILNEIDTVFTEPISLNNIFESGAIQAFIVPGQSSLKVEGSNEIQVEYTIVKRENVNELQKTAKK